MRVWLIVTFILIIALVCFSSFHISIVKSGSESFSKKLSAPLSSKANYMRLSSDQLFYSTDLKVEATESESDKCFNLCDVNPECTGVSMIQDKNKSNWECYFGSKDNLINKDDLPKSGDMYYDPYTFQKVSQPEKQTQTVYVYQDVPYYDYGYYPTSLLPVYNWPWWGGGYYGGGYGGGRPHHGGGGRPRPGGGGGRPGGGGGGGGAPSGGGNVGIGYGGFSIRR